MVSAKYLIVSFKQMLDIFLVKAYSMFILNICQANGLFAFLFNKIILIFLDSIRKKKRGDNYNFPCYWFQIDLNHN